MNTNICDLREDYLDGCLTSDATSEFEQHLELCDDCRVQLSQLKELDSLIVDAWSEIRLPNRLRQNTKCSQPLPAPAQPSFRRNFAFSSAALAGLTAAILVTSFLTNRTFEKPKEMAAESATDDINTVQPVAFFETGDNGTLLSPIVSTADFTIVKAFPLSSSTNTKPKSIQ